MYCSRFILGAVAAMMLSGTAMGQQLIGPNLLNGGFELLNGATGSAAKATHFDTDPDGDVNNWAYIGTAPGDEGTDVVPAPNQPLQGLREAFFDDNDSIYNLTSYVVAVGDVIDFSWTITIGGRGPMEAQLGYGAGATPFGPAATTPNLAAYGTVGSGTYTVLAADPVVGQTLGLILRGGTAATAYVTNFPEFDNVVLGVNLAPLIPGDVDGDQDVDDDDFGIIRDHFRQNVLDRGNGNLVNTGASAGVVDFADYLQWRANYPFPGSGGGAGNFSLDAAPSVPEPTGLALAAIAMGAMLTAGSRRKRY